MYICRTGRLPSMLSLLRLISPNLFLSCDKWQPTLCIYNKFLYRTAFSQTNSGSLVDRIQQHLYEEMESAVICIQKVWKGYKERSRWKGRQEEFERHKAAITIQRNVSWSFFLFFFFFICWPCTRAHKTHPNFAPELSHHYSIKMKW